MMVVVWIYALVWTLLVAVVFHIVVTGDVCITANALDAAHAEHAKIPLSLAGISSFGCTNRLGSMMNHLRPKLTGPLLIRHGSLYIPLGAFS